MVREQIVGQVVINKRDEKLIVKDCTINKHGVVETVACEMLEGGELKRFGSEPFDNGFLRFDNPDVQEEINHEIAVRLEAKNTARIASEKAYEDYKINAWEEAKQKAASRPAPVSSGNSRARTLEEMFDPRFNVRFMKKNDVCDYKEVEAKWDIVRSGWGRGINDKSDAIILISSIDKHNGFFVYHDHWTEEGDYVFSGEGSKGDQKMEGGNKAIADAIDSGKPIHLYIKTSSKTYYYQGVFKCVKYDYIQDQDEDGNVRKEYQFILRRY